MSSTGAARVALVTGASSGFGAAIARAFGELGWPVALGARRTDKLEEVAREVEKLGGRAFPHPLDVREGASIDAFVGAVERELGPPDAVVSNAGIVGIPSLLHERTEEELRSELDTNLWGPMLLARRVIPGMVERRGGDLVFVSSLNAVMPRPLQAGYTASKTGLEAMVRVLQMDLEGSGVRATIVRPGPSRTEMGWEWDGAIVKRMLETWTRFGVLRHHNYLPPEAIAQAVVQTVTAPPGQHVDVVQINPVPPTEAPSS